MRNTDPDPEPFRPLGEKVVREQPKQEWWPLPHNPGVEVDARGRVRTKPPLPVTPKKAP
jgi:hypothetical protein